MCFNPALLMNVFLEAQIITFSDQINANYTRVFKVNNLGNENYILSLLITYYGRYFYVYKQWQQ
jgi:hypothetical protein